MTKLNVILCFTAAALALTTFDGVNAASLRSTDNTERFLTSFDGSFDTSDSGEGDRFLLEMEGSESSETDNSDSFGFGGIRFLADVEGSESAEGSESIEGDRFLQEVDSSDSSDDSDSSESDNGERFLAEMEDTESTEGSESGSA